MPDFSLRFILVLSIVLTILLGGAVALLWLRPVSSTGPIVSPANVATGAFSGDFTLVDEKGATVTPKTYGTSYKLVFFGFTHCPTVCPTALVKIADILAGLPKDTAGRLVPLFITVDPERDTPEALRTYTDNFDPRIVGLTGSRAQVDAAIAGFKVYAARVDTGHGDYTMDHSTFMYLLGPDQTLRAIFYTEETVPDIVARIKDMVR